MKLPWERRLAFTLGLGTAAVPGMDDYLTITRHGKRMFETYVPKRVQPAAKLGLRGANVIGGVAKAKFAYEVGKEFHSRNMSTLSTMHIHGYDLPFWPLHGGNQTAQSLGRVIRNNPLPPQQPYVHGGVVYLP